MGFTCSFREKDREKGGGTDDGGGGPAKRHVEFSYL